MRLRLTPVSYPAPATSVAGGREWVKWLNLAQQLFPNMSLQAVLV